MNFLLKKFNRLGFIEYNGENPLKVNSSLLTASCTSEGCQAA